MNRRPQASLERVSGLLKAVADRKAMRVADQEIDPDTLDARDKGKLQLEILTEFLVVVLVRNVPDEARNDVEKIDERIQRAAAAMGVDGVKIAWNEIKDSI